MISKRKVKDSAESPKGVKRSVLVKSKSENTILYRRIEGFIKLFVRDYSLLSSNSFFRSFSSIMSSISAS